jgi:tRNA(Met) C34 N-acetyltransferase TmcA
MPLFVRRLSHSFFAHPKFIIIKQSNKTVANQPTPRHAVQVQPSKNPTKQTRSKHQLLQ